VNLTSRFARVKPSWFTPCGIERQCLPEKPIRPTTLEPMILILSDDAVAAALLGALIETLGYSVKFARPPESAEQSIRRVRPKVCLLDCEDPGNCSTELLGRAAMRRIPVVIFGTTQALERVRQVAAEHDIEMLLVPPDAEVLDMTLKRALRRAG
jgi:DNA-binding NtrC family response regulator